MDIIGAIKGIVKRDIDRRALNQDCGDCVDAFTRKPVGGKWTLGVDTKPIRYHWLADDAVPERLPYNKYPTYQAICGKEVVGKS